MRNTRTLLLAGFLAGVAFSIVLLLVHDPRGRPAGAQDRRLPSAEDQDRLRAEIRGLPDPSPSFVEESPQEY
jgi:hypothetical protein